MLRDNTIVDSEKLKEAVNHPQHYQSSRMEVIEVIEAFDLGFCLGNTVKYVLRAGKKDSLKTVEDLKKAVWYLNREIESREGLTTLSKFEKENPLLVNEAYIDALKEELACVNKEMEELHAKLEKKQELIREARTYILEAKAKFYPNVTNSFINDWLEKTKS